MPKQRKNYSPEEKVKILREHYENNIPVSEICDKYSLNPVLFYRWKKDFFENASQIFRKPSTAGKTAELRKIAYLEDKLKEKEKVIVELVTENIIHKKKVYGEH